MGSAVGQVPEYIEMVARWCKAAHAHAGHRQADAQHHRHPPAGARGAKRRRRRGVAHQHHQFDHGHRPRPHDARRRTSTARARTAACAARRSSRSRCRWCRRSPATPETRGPADLGHRRHHHLARRGRVHRARRRQRAGLHRRDDLRLQDRRRRWSPALPTTWTRKATRRSRISAAAPCPTSPTGSISTSTMSRRPRSIRTSASNAAAATSSARTPRIRRSSPTVDGVRKFVVNDAECVGCNLCVLVCPVENCITLVHKTEGVDPRTGLPYDRPPRDWTKHPNNPAVHRQAAE